MVALVCGVGINDRSIPSNINVKPTKEYNIWRHMLIRVYSNKQVSEHPTYVGCSVSKMFLHFDQFYNWCQTQIGFNDNSYQLDKDLLVKGNKQYNEQTCIFIPPAINSLLTSCSSVRGLLPIGVSKNGNKFMAQCRKDGKKKHIGTFETPELAFEAYKTFKEAYIKEQAELYKNSIDPRAYLALINYEVSIDD